MVPFGRKYFIQEILDFDNHLWIAGYDVSSLIIWRHDGKLPITRAISLGTTDALYKSAASKTKRDDKIDYTLDIKKVVQVLKQGMLELP
jgi:hypothetical protein